MVTLDRYGRTVDKVWLDGRDINRELVAEGHAWVYRKYMTDETLLEDGQAARETRRGYGGCRRPSAWRPGSGRRTGAGNLSGRLGMVAVGEAQKQTAPKFVPMQLQLIEYMVNKI